jgi:ankyrin repeat protein
LTKRGRKRTAILAGAIAFLLIAGLGWLAYSGMRQDHLDRALFEALDQGKPLEVTSLLRHGANPNAHDRRQEPPVTVVSFVRNLFRPDRNVKRGDSALIFVASWHLEGFVSRSYNRYECFRALIDAGADVNEQDEDGTSAMMYCIMDTDAVIYLLNHGANPNLANSNGVTALLFAANSNYTDDLHLLNEMLAHGAIVDKPEGLGRTPLIVAASNLRADWVKILLAHGANPNIRDKDGKTAIDHVFHNEADDEQTKKAEHEIDQALIRAGAKSNPPAEPPTDGTFKL